MRKLLILAAAAAVSAACHNRSENVGAAAPDRGGTTAAAQRGDTTAVTHVIDSTRTGPPGVAGRPGNTTVTPDSVGADSTMTGQRSAATPTATDTSSLTSTPQDTLGPRETGVRDSTTMQSDSAATNHAV